MIHMNQIIWDIVTYSNPKKDSKKLENPPSQAVNWMSGGKKALQRESRGIWDGANIWNYKAVIYPLAI